MLSFLFLDLVRNLCRNVVSNRLQTNINEPDFGGVYMVVYNNTGWA